MSNDNGTYSHDEEQAKESLKQILSIVAGVTIANGALVLITGGGYTQVRSFRGFPTEDLVYFTLLVSNIIRFYHGNVRLLDESFGTKKHASNSSSRNLGVDFLVMFAQSLLFAAMSFYLGRSFEFFTLFTVLLVLDVVWYLLTLGYTADGQAFTRQKNWTLNNVLGVIVLLMLAIMSSKLGSVTYVRIQSIVVGLNTLVDFAVSWGFYFPSGRPKQPVVVHSGDGSSSHQTEA